jgi:acyl carrier protein
MQTKELLDIIADKTTGIDVFRLDPDERLDEQGLDSLDIMSTLFEVEERYQVKINEDDISQGRLSSLSDIINFVNSTVK